MVCCTAPTPPQFNASAPTIQLDNDGAFHLGQEFVFVKDQDLVSVHNVWLEWFNGHLRVDGHAQPALNDLELATASTKKAWYVQGGCQVNSGRLSSKR